MRKDKFHENEWRQVCFGNGLLGCLFIRVFCLYSMTAEKPHSMCSAVLMELFESYVAANSNIDTSRIYVGGCSNGGYMIMKLLILHPDYFATAFPACEAYLSEYITDEQIDEIKDIPIWFTHSSIDPVVPPGPSTVATYKRLVAAGAENVHFTYWTDNKDLSGLYNDGKGNAYFYTGHHSWIHVLNNACTIDNDYVEGQTTDSISTGQTIFEWMAEQVNDDAVS